MRGSAGLEEGEGLIPSVAGEAGGEVSAVERRRHRRGGRAASASAAAGGHAKGGAMARVVGGGGMGERSGGLFGGGGRRRVDQKIDNVCISFFSYKTDEASSSRVFVGHGMPDAGCSPHVFSCQLLYVLRIPKKKKKKERK